ncbi:ABC transporter permease [Celerinatantimonas sp. YJH-8]|uniref:ABC transporter permease n=1 Tax=Celerinatantimonas sp. YJH-8 TaxID=3228714 RepID=UPI0038C9841A
MINSSHTNTQPKRWGLTPLKPVNSSLKWGLGISFFILFVALWAFVSFTGIVSSTFLADPISMLEEGYELFTQYNFSHDIIVTILRVLGGFCLAAVIGVPLGIMMGAYKAIEALLEPFVSFCRYLPASAFIPLLILWAGVGELQKILIIFIGSFFQITLMVSVTVSQSRRDLIEAAYTLGSSRWGVVKRVVIPASAPEIAESLRLVLGWSWTYVIVAELIGSQSGIGHMIVDSQSLLNTGQIIFGIITIGIIGLISDMLFKRCNRRLFAWSLL